MDMTREIDDGIVTMRLYRIFRIPEEDYPTTLKLKYIYKWARPRTGDMVFDVLTELRKAFYDESNRNTLDRFYNELKIINMAQSGRYDTSCRHIPMNYESNLSGWKV